jgi:hypothetical protein
MQNDTGTENIRSGNQFEASNLAVPKNILTFIGLWVMSQ